MSWPVFFFFSSLFFASCNVILIPESSKCLLGEFEILAIQLKVSGILLTIRIRNTSSTDKESGIQRLESGIHGLEFVVPENIHTRPPPHGGQRKSEGRGGKLLINNSFSVEQAISYRFTLNRCFKTSINDRLLSMVGWMLFSRLTR